MKLLSPSPPPEYTQDLFSGFRNPAAFPPGFRRRSQTVMADEGGAKVYVAVGKSFEKAAALLQWTLRAFVDSKICILHVHQPSLFIPTLLGKLPASQANDEVVTAFRHEERQATRKLLGRYMNICTRSKVEASIITSEADQVHKEIVDLVARHNIKKLVVGAVPEYASTLIFVDSCIKLKKSSKKVSYAAKMAPPFCEIWFVSKGALVWKRQPAEGSSYFEQPSQEGNSTASNLLSQSLQSSKGDIVLTPQCVRAIEASTASPGMGNLSQRGVSFGVASNHTISKMYNSSHAHISSPADFSSSSGTSSAEPSVFSYSGTRKEEGDLYEQLAELMREAEKSREEASTEILMRKKLEVEVLESINEVNEFVSARAREVELRKEAEDELRNAILQQEKLIAEREETTRELQKAMRSIAVLDNRAQEANRRCNEVAGELELIKASIDTLRQEKNRIQRQKIEATLWLDRWKNCSQTGAGSISGFMQFTGDAFQLAEFSLSDLQAATCNFSESFMIGQGGYGAVYKGELLGRTVSIKRLHPHNIHRQSEFYQEAQVLGRLRHPHLVSLIGVCPEAWSLVYDHIPGRSLQDRLFSKSNNSPLDWKTRVRMIAEIASCLLFLHSLNAEEIVHGDLKPNNILLDSRNSCKVCDFGITRLLPDQALRCSSFRHSTEIRCAFPYADPEMLRVGIPTPKSDIFSFGIIILQIVTRKSSAGLITEARKAVSRGKTMSIVDSSAGDWSMFVARRLVELGIQCCELKSKDRPEMTPMLVRELEQLYTLEDRLVPSFFVCPILQEIMHDPRVAADGFTYECEALQDWLENGRETSPMTNLKLDHLTLTPNHSLRLAIQEWVRNLQEYD